MFATTLAATEPSIHCADSRGRIIGLAADGKYRLTLPKDGPPAGDNPEKWTPVTDGDAKNSFTGTYLQVLPDDRDSYYDIHGPSSFTMTGIEFPLRITEPGLHTLYVRWTGGDKVGGGDSLYAVLFNSSRGAVSGVPTLKPKLEKIDEKEGKYAGCCYSMVTHACPCCLSEFGWSSDNKPPGCDFWVSAETAGSRYGMRCESGHGELEAVNHPRWYLFAGQTYGNVMDFNSEPWDATCEADGTGTADTGLDIAQWDLRDPGDYTLAFYPREDGTAFDAFYMSTPSNPVPPNGLSLELGNSTVNGCPATTPLPHPSRQHRRSLEASSCDAGGVHGSSLGPELVGMAGGAAFVLFLFACCCGCLLCAAIVRFRHSRGLAPLPPLSSLPCPTPITIPRIRSSPTAPPLAAADGVNTNQVGGMPFSSTPYSSTA